MLARSERLTTEEYKRVFDQGALSHTTKATLRLLFVSAEETIRTKNVKKAFVWAVNVPKKVASGAVVRNRIRRQSYEAIREVMDEFEAESDSSEDFLGAKYIIIIWKPAILNETFDEIKQSLEEILLKAGVISKRG
jgi:ribonuclease P protein component